MASVINRMTRLALFALPLAFWSCASVPHEKNLVQWTCDPQADSAETSGDWHQALSRHQAFLAQHPDNCLAVYHLGYIWGRMGDRQKESDQYEKAVTCGYNKDDLLFFNMGMAYAEMDQMEKSVAAFERAVALRPDNADNYFGLGLAARSAGRTDYARQMLEKAVKLDPRHWDARVEMARIDLDQGRLEAARIQLEAIQQGAPEHEELQTLWRIYSDRKVTSFMPGAK